MLNHRRLGKGPTLILIHGFLGGSGYWAPVFEHLASSLDIVAPDLPGFAGSGNLPACDSIADFAAAVAQLADSLGVEKFSLVGHSMGGMVAQQVALDYPRRVEKLVLYGTAASGRLPDRFETFADSIGRIERDGLAAAAERIVASWFMAGKANPAYGLCLQAGKGVSERAAIATLRAVERWDVRERLTDIENPTLVITGDRDRSTSPAEAFALWRSIKGAQLCIAPNSAHAVHLEKPDFMNLVLGGFLGTAATDPGLRGST